MDDIIKVKHRGSFHVGGEKVKLENAPVEDFPYQGKFTFHSDPNGTHWAKQMYVQYTELAEPVSKYPILMWHGGGLTGVTWETTPDGREGFDTLFLRHGFNVYTTSMRSVRSCSFMYSGVSSSRKLGISLRHLARMQGS